jgi:hypothetical protein
MSQQQINRSPDLKRLRDEGYEIQVKGGYLVTHHIPYVTAAKEIKYGKLIVQLAMNNDITIRPQNHVINFMGEQPCNNDGSIIHAIVHGEVNQILFDGIVINRSFSNKPPNGYENYYHQVTRYAEIISAPAYSIDNSVVIKTYRVIDSEGSERFNYYDTNTSKANIYAINAKLENQKIGIIGLGGTGSYILDLIAKAPVSGIHLFDADVFLQHNAFRFPGAASTDDLDVYQKKVDYLEKIYSRMHKGIVSHPTNITEANLFLLDEMSYVFLCVDNNLSRKLIIDYLIAKGIPFFDVGLGVNVAGDTLVGTVRMTVGTKQKSDHINFRVPFDDNDNNEYRTNIQIAELNSFNAALAVIKWKKMSGFYQDLEMEHHTSYSINLA